MKFSTRGMVRGALMTALLCVLAQISIPMGTVPMTLQTFAVALAGYALGARGGALALLVYLLLGACGLPVFSGMNGGLGRLVGGTGGFLLGFPVMALLCGLGKKGSLWIRVAAGLGGLLVVHIMGVAQLSVVAQLSIRQAMLAGSLPFILKDAGSVLAAALLEKAVSARLDRA